MFARHSFDTQTQPMVPLDARTCSDDLIGSFLHPDDELCLEKRVQLQSKLEAGIFY